MRGNVAVTGVTARGRFCGVLQHPGGVTEGDGRRVGSSRTGRGPQRPVRRVRGVCAGQVLTASALVIACFGC